MHLVYKLCPPGAIFLHYFLCKHKYKLQIQLFFITLVALHVNIPLEENIGILTRKAGENIYCLYQNQRKTYFFDAKIRENQGICFSIPCLDPVLFFWIASFIVMWHSILLMKLDPGSHKFLLHFIAVCKKHTMHHYTFLLENNMFFYCNDSERNHCFVSVVVDMYPSVSIIVC